MSMTALDWAIAVTYLAPSTDRATLVVFVVSAPVLARMLHRRHVLEP
jgi:hypothetical protein